VSNFEHRSFMLHSTRHQLPVR